MPEEGWDTLGGMLLDGLGHVPEIGETLHTEGFAFVIEAVEGRRITEVHVKRTQTTINLADSDSGLLSNG